MTTAFNYNNVALSWLGQYADYPFQSQNTRNVRGQNSEIRFKATGTDLTIRSLVNTTGTNYLQASVDGGAFANLSMSGLTVNTWSDVSVFSGLTDTQHTVIIRHNTGTQTNVFYQRSSMLSLTGAAPALAAYDDITNIYDIGSYPFAARSKIEGGCQISTTFNYLYPAAVQFPWGDTVIRFKSDASAISFWGWSSPSKWAIIQDGVELATASPAANVFGLTSMATGLSGIHEYELVMVTSSAPGTAGVAGQLVLGGGSALSASYITRKALVVLGDSIVACTGTTDSSKGFCYKLARSKGYESWNRGVSGQRVVPSTAATPGEVLRWIDAVAFYAPLSAPAYIIFQIGHNDASASVDRTDFQASYLQMLTAVSAACPTSTILVMGIVPTTAFTTTVRTNYNSDIQSAISALVAANVTYVSTDSLWGTGGAAPTTNQINNNTVDGTHPTDAGYDAIVTLMSSYVSSFVPASNSNSSPIGG